MLKFVETGAGLMIKNRKGYLGVISTGGRWPGRWSIESEMKCSASPAEMAEIGRKCVEIRRQVQSTRAIRTKLFE